MAMPLRSPALPNGYDVEAVRRDFPILSQSVNGKPLVFLDSAASAQKPRQVIEAMSGFLMADYANVHRGIYQLSQRATDLFEGTRVKVARYLNAPSPETVVLTRNATEAFNLLAHSLGAGFAAGDEVVISEMEHHANIVPWQMLCERTGVALKVAPITDDGDLMLDALDDLIGPRTRLVSISHASNVLGTINPAAEIVRIAHAKGVPVAFDGSQAAVHSLVDVQAIDADFYIFTGHKLYGPTGIGVLYAKAEHLAAMPPFLGGGDMIESVSFTGTTYKDGPARFEAGTPPIIEGVGLSAAIDYVVALGREAIAAHEADLLAYATERLSAIDGLRMIGTARDKVAICSFVLGDVHAHDVGTILDQAGIAVRVGQHCAEPLMDRFGVTSTTRASFGLYNTRAEVDALVDGLHLVQELFG